MGGGLEPGVGDTDGLLRGVMRWLRAAAGRVEVSAGTLLAAALPAGAAGGGCW